MENLLFFCSFVLLRKSNLYFNNTQTFKSFPQGIGSEKFLEKGIKTEGDLLIQDRKLGEYCFLITFDF